MNDDGGARDRIGAADSVAEEIDETFDILGSRRRRAAVACLADADDDRIGLEELAAAVRESLAYLERLKHDVGGAEETTWANFCLSDGEAIVATRYASPADATAQSLYVGEAGSFVDGGEFAATPDPTGDAATIVASEPLFEDDRVWRSVPRNHLVAVAPDGETAIEPLDLDVAA